MTSFRNLKGDHVEQREEFSNNRITVHGDGSAIVLAVGFLIVLVSAALIWLVVNFGNLLGLIVLALLLTGSVGLIVLTGVRVYTLASIWFIERKHAAAMTSVLHATDHFILWVEPDGSYQFRGSTIITENRQFLPKEIAPPSQQEGILALYDSGMSGRAIEKHMNQIAKDAGSPKVPYREIQRVLNLYRPDWSKKGEVKSDIVDADPSQSATES